MLLHHDHVPAGSTETVDAHLKAVAVPPLQIPEWCESSWQSLLEACWEVSPSARPHLRDLVRLGTCSFGNYSNCGSLLALVQHLLFVWLLRTPLTSENFSVAGVSTGGHPAVGMSTI